MRLRFVAPDRYVALADDYLTLRIFHRNARHAVVLPGQLKGDIDGRPELLIHPWTNIDVCDACDVGLEADRLPRSDGHQDWACQGEVRSAFVNVMSD